MKESGFTLIELMIVISLIAILSAVGLANLSSILNRSRIQNEADNLSFAFKKAQAVAVSSSLPTAVKMTSSSYLVCQARISDCSCIRSPILTWNIKYGTLEVPSQTQGCVIFDSFGKPRLSSSEFLSYSYNFDLSYKNSYRSVEVTKQGRISVE